MSAQISIIVLNQFSTLPLKRHFTHTEMPSFTCQVYFLQIKYSTLTCNKTSVSVFSASLL